AAAQATGGSGFIACFVGGLLLSGLRRHHKQALLGGAVATGEAMALLTWIAFGVGALPQIIGRLSWAAIAYAVLSLTVIRMVPASPGPGCASPTSCLSPGLARAASPRWCSG